jgi:flavin reductase (DIM6/NTAB) family NADH-FMN oxidoreductase RutF
MNGEGLSWTLDQLWSPPVAVTAAHEGRRSALIASTAVTASLIPESPRVVLVLAQANLTHDVVLASGAFALHLLAAVPLRRSLELIRMLGMRSGRDGDKLAGISARPGVTGSPILADALGYVEARVAASLDGDEVTVFLADVVAGSRLRDGDRLTMEAALAAMPADWLDEWEARRERELAEARRRRGDRPGGSAAGPS